MPNVSQQTNSLHIDNFPNLFQVVSTSLPAANTKVYVVGAETASPVAGAPSGTVRGKHLVVDTVHVMVATTDVDGTTISLRNGANANIVASTVFGVSGLTANTLHALTVDQDENVLAPGTVLYAHRTDAAGSNDHPDVTFQVRFHTKQA